jgi:hypothetical protein
MAGRREMILRDKLKHSPSRKENHKKQQQHTQQQAAVIRQLQAELKAARDEG